MERLAQASNLNGKSLVLKTYMQLLEVISLMVLILNVMADGLVYQLVTLRSKTLVVFFHQQGHLSGRKLTNLMM